MKLTLALATLLGLAIAAPTDLDRRQNVGSTANDIDAGLCRRVTFIFARGSTETGNLGSIIGPPVANGLKARFGTTNVAVQGVNYAALLTTNFIPNGGDPVGIADMQNQLRRAAVQCPNTQILAGGYSQGAAISHQAVQTLDAATRNRIKAIVTFGDTQNLQDGGRVPNYPPAQTKIFCALGDLVCDGTLIIDAAHLSYGVDAGAAVSFLSGFIR